MTAELTRPAVTIPVAKPWLGEAEAAAAAEAVSTGWIAQGPRVAEFERRFAERVGARHGVAVSSCTTALHLALVLAGIGPGDEVVVPSLSFIATANAVRYVGADPIFADVDEDSLALTPATVEPVLTPRTRAVLVVHQVGEPADIASLQRLLEGRRIELIEDAACAAGSTYAGRPIGGHSRFVAFSFHPRKVITTGEGGLLALRDAGDAVLARRLREHAMSVSAADRHASGTTTPESYLEVGFNYRMTDIQAAVGLVQLEKLEEIVRRRRALAARYDGLLAELPDVRIPRRAQYGESNFQSYWIELPDGADRDVVMARLADDGVSARRGIMAAHVEPAYSDVEHVPLPITERITARSLILPLFPQMGLDEQDRVVEALAHALFQEETR